MGGKVAVIPCGVSGLERADLSVARTFEAFRGDNSRYSARQSGKSFKAASKMHPETRFSPASISRWWKRSIAVLRPKREKTAFHYNHTTPYLTNPHAIKSKRFMLELPSAVPLYSTQPTSMQASHPWSCSRFLLQPLSTPSIARWYYPAAEACFPQQMLGQAHLRSPPSPALRPQHH